MKRVGGGACSTVQARTKELLAFPVRIAHRAGSLLQTEKLASLGPAPRRLAHEIQNPRQLRQHFLGLFGRIDRRTNEVLKSSALADKVRERFDELTHLP